MDDRSSNSNLNASASASASSAHASAGHSPAALSSASSSGPLTHAHAATTVADQHASSRTLLANPAVSLAPSPASVVSSLSGHKRAAEPDGGHSSAAAADGPAVPSLLPAAALSSSGDESSLSEPQSKKHRGGSALVGRSLAPAAVTAGFNPLPADPISSGASVSASNEHSSSAPCMTDALSSSSTLSGQRKEAPLVGSADPIGFAGVSSWRAAVFVVVIAALLLTLATSGAGTAAWTFAAAAAAILGFSAHGSQFDPSSSSVASAVPSSARSDRNTTSAQPSMDDHGSSSSHLNACRADAPPAPASTAGVLSSASSSTAGAAAVPSLSPAAALSATGSAELVGSNSVASASRSDEHSSPAPSMSDALSSSSAVADERKETSQAAGCVVSIGLAAASTESSSSSAPTGRPCPFDDPAISQLAVAGVALASAEVQRYRARAAPVIAQMLEYRSEAEAQLEAYESMPEEEQVFMEGRMIEAWARIDSMSSGLEKLACFDSWCRDELSFARAHATQRPVDPQAVARLCMAVCDLVATPGSSESEHGLRAWLQRVDAQWTRLSSTLARVSLTSDECREWLIGAVKAGALQAVSALMQQSNMQTGCDWLSVHFADWCKEPEMHGVCHRPYLRLFEYGLDPAHIIDGPSSALQMARKFMRDQPLNAGVAAASMDPAAASSSSVKCDPIPSILSAYATQQWGHMNGTEPRRRKAAHAQFMHALIPAWRAHSVKVLSLLSSPSVLLPELAAIVGRYLDLEGLPPDSASTVDTKSQSAIRGAAIAQQLAAASARLTEAAAAASSASGSSVPLCSNPACGRSASLRCSRCHLSLYCSAACQKADFKSHKARVCVPREYAPSGSQRGQH